MPTEAASCTDLVQIYPSDQGGVTVLRGIHARFPTGTVTAIVGPSGAGKSTLLRLMACLEAPSAGQITIGCQPTAHLSARARRQLVARRIGYVFQRPPENLIDYLTVSEHLQLAWQMRGFNEPFETTQLLNSAALGEAARRRPRELSDGQQQRLAVAMAVAGHPDLVIADEPTAELDPDDATTLANTLIALAHRGQTFVVSSHDPILIDQADQVLVIRGGVLAAIKTGTGPTRVAVDPAGRLLLPDEALQQLPGHVADVIVQGETITLRQP
jgi:putative ABC transport system ATP-binding protein